ncbi:MAG TPA: DeoR/GlpR family DNA-binding transcription regulator [Amycolatopsis sp.]|uniref:DeoR/GlpR family DNA-binding transcription regulator n=1 Tax=Amycolatopsis sp. TaxID=37632 RepID=UPI002B4A6BA8|nr:DeoR/GlpR family DNA-binding transcription regulator [Amycolatopsis sp.]HKS48936.1 DeoR/GlpR family DNA-binding transcription regulator [Amycolatopsis sp.]
MLARQRQAVILEEARRTGAVLVSDLVAKLGVSDMTIRRDLDVLAGRGLVEKVYGGATAILGKSTDEPGFEAKSVQQRTQKEAIAELAAKLVRPGTAIGISAGTTTWTLARALGSVPGLTVVTNSIRVADVLRDSPQPDRSVVLTGGVRTPSDALVGPVAVHSLRRLHLDLVFLGVHGMAEGPGFTTPNLTESETDRALVEAGRRFVVLADHTKWGIVGISTIASLDEANVVVTDDGLAEPARQTLAEHVGELLIAQVEDADPEGDGAG